MVSQPYVLRIAIQYHTTRGFTTDVEYTKTYATKQGLLQGAHYWARWHQVDNELWMGGYYSNYTLTKKYGTQRIVMHAFQRNATKDFQALSIELTSIVSRKGLGEDVRGEAYKKASSSKASV
jgi:hypothetical protein